MQSTPLDEREFSALMANISLPKDAPIAVAVSGGTDSMALCLLAQEWATSQDRKMIALTLDHKLRPESAREATQVGLWLAVRGITHHILTWEHAAGDLQGNLQEQARNARYGLLEEWCQANGVEYLLIAHHQEDQAETFLLRLARGSGVDGLSAMSPMSQRGGITLLRPLLDTPKARLIATLRARGQEWLDDPSNHNRDFDRVRMRQLMPALAHAGLTPHRLAQTAHHMRRARQALEATTNILLAAATQTAGEQTIVQMPLLLAAKKEIALRALARLIEAIGGCGHPPRMGDLERLYHHLHIIPSKPYTLGKCLFCPSRKKKAAETWSIKREKQRRVGLATGNEAA